MSSFVVMCKVIGCPIQSRLIYLPAKYQGRAIVWTRILSKWLLKMVNCFFILTLWHFWLMKPIYKAMHLRRTSSLGIFCTPLIIILLLLRWGWCSYRCALFSSRRLGLDSGLFVVNLVNFDAWLFIYTVFFVWKKYRQKRVM